MLVCDREMKLILEERGTRGGNKRKNPGLLCAEDGDGLAINPWWPCLEVSLDKQNRDRATEKH